MIEGRNRQKQFRVEGAHPGEIDEGVVLAFDIANAGVLRILIVRHLKKIPAHCGYQPKLIFRIGVEDERGKASEAVALIMLHLPHRSLQAVITAVAINAGVVTKTLRMIAETQLVVCLIEVAVRDKQLR